MKATKTFTQRYLPKIQAVVFMAICLAWSLNSHAQAYANATLLKYRVDTGVTLKTSSNKVRATTEGALMKSILDFVLQNTDTLGATTNGLQYVLDNGNTSMTGIYLGKAKSLNTYNSIRFALDATDSSGTINLRDSSGTLLFSANKTGIYSKSAATAPYLIGTGSAPTVVLNSCAGTGATYTITGTQGHGYIAVTAGTSPCSGTNTFFSINYPTVFAGTPTYISISPRNDNAAAVWAAGGILYSAATTTSSGTITRAASTIVSGTVYEYYYNIEQ